MSFSSIIHSQVKRCRKRKNVCCRIVIACLAAILVINYNISLIKDNIYNVTISNNIATEQVKNHPDHYLDRVNFTRTKNISTDLLFFTSSSKPSSSSSSLIKLYSYDLLRHPDAHKLRQKLKDYKKNNETTVSCKLEDAKLHPYHAQIKLTALASFPRSGNTWLRTLIEKSTGYQTSSVYCDTKLSSFKAECIQSNLFLVKTHEESTSTKVQNRSRNYDQFIYLIRNPFDAILSYYQYAESEKNLTEKNRTSHEASLDFHTTLALSSVSVKMVEELVNAYSKSFHYWQSVQLPHIDIRYEDLKQSPGIILRYVRMFLVPVSIEDYHNYTNGTRSNFSYYFDHSSIISTTNHETSKYIEEGDKQIACATEEDVWIETLFIEATSMNHYIH